MAKTFNFISLSVIISCLYSISCVSSQQETHFLHHGFLGANLLRYGSSKIHPNGLLELTNTSKRQMGQAFHGFPISFLKPNSSDSLSFSTSFVFSIVSGSDPPGHGLAFVISPSMDFTRALPSQFIGLFNMSNNGNSLNHILAIEFDTVESIEFQDINDNHVGIDLNSLISIASAPAAYFDDQDSTNKSLKLAGPDAIQVWIEYDDNQTLLNVTLAPPGRPRPSLPLLSRKLNLSTILGEEIYVGFSAATGTVTSSHYILGWSFSKGGRAQDFDISKLPSRPEQPLSPSPSPLISRKNKQNNTKLIIICVASATLLVILVILLGCWVFHEKGRIFIGGARRLSYPTILKTTKDFDGSRLLGEGRSGSFYGGELSAAERIAVKRVTCNTRQQKLAAQAESEAIAKLRHRNLVSLLGYCSRKNNFCFIYEYIPNGSLDRFLFNNDRPNLNWSDRFKIIKGIASALLYLHGECQRIFLHKNVKASNVLLDEELNARLGDYGVGNKREDSGHTAPELIDIGTETRDTDVYAFGILMLEIVCGRRAIEPTRPPEEISLMNWVLQGFKTGDLLKRCDARMEGNYVAREVLVVLKSSLLCSNRLPQARPSMKKVVQYLDGSERLPHDDYLFYGI